MTGTCTRRCCRSAARSTGRIRRAPWPARRFFRHIVGLQDESRLAFKRGLLALNRDRVRQAAETWFGRPPAQQGVAVIGGQAQLDDANAALGDRPLALRKI